MVRSAATLVPEGKVLKVTESSEDGRVLSRYTIDPALRVCVCEGVDETFATSFSALAVCDDSGRSEICGATLEVFDSSITYEDMVSQLDHLAGEGLEKVGAEEVAGSTKHVVKTTKTVQGHDGPMKIDVTGFVDPETGLVSREEIVTESGRLMLEREIVLPSDEGYGSLVRSEVRRLAKELRQERIAALSQCSYEVFAIPNGFDGLSLLWVMASADGNWCRLEYETASAPGRPAASVQSWNLAAYPDYPVDMLNPLSEARIDDSPEAHRASFRIGDTGVQVQTEKPRLDVAAIQLAAQLVLVTAAGLE